MCIRDRSWLKWYPPNLAHSSFCHSWQNPVMAHFSFYQSWFNRKASYGHPTLTPGIFTVYCPHGICFGFEVMQRCESPRVPFKIFTSRFSTPPQVIIYDNACKLHAYCLNREPALYRYSRFFVDRFHWCGHVGCSRRYCLDLYKSMDIKTINSQVNEQANSGLQRIRGQLAYMKQSNFMFTLSLFLLVNRDKIRAIDVSTLVVG